MRITNGVLQAMNFLKRFIWSVATVFFLLGMILMGVVTFLWWVATGKEPNLILDWYEARWEPLRKWLDVW